MKKIFMATILIFGIVAGQILSAEATANGTWHLEFKCRNCDKVVTYEGMNESYRPGGASEGVCNGPEGKEAFQKWGNTNAPISYKEGHLWEPILMKQYVASMEQWVDVFKINLPDRAVREEQARKREAEYNAKQLAEKEKLQAYIQVLKTSAANAADYESQANAKFKAKDYTAAKQLYVNAIETNPYESSYFLELAKCYMKDKDKNYDLVIYLTNVAIDRQVERMENLTGASTQSRPGRDVQEDKLKMAEYWEYLSSIYNRMAMNNFFKSINKLTDYSRISQNSQIVANTYKNATNPNMPTQPLPGLIGSARVTGSYSNLKSLRKMVLEGTLQTTQTNQARLPQQQTNPIGGILGKIFK